MFQIVIVPNNSASNTALSYKSKINFDIARKNIHERMRSESLMLVQDDDAGQAVEIPVDSIAYVMHIDIAAQQAFALWAKGMAQQQVEAAEKPSNAGMAA